MGRLGRRMGKLEGVTHMVVPPRSGWDRALLDDDELEELAALAKAEEANRTGVTAVWSADEEEALDTLGATAYRDGSATARDTN